MRYVVSLISGIIFGLGLAISAMINPDKVLGFLNVFGKWDPSLIFVMIGALLISVPAFTFIKNKNKPICEDSFSLPTKTNIDKKLIIGSLIFGIGWGLVGLCPGPAIAAVALFNTNVIIFLVSMIIGFVLQKLITK